MRINKPREMAEERWEVRFMKTSEQMNERKNQEARVETNKQTNERAN